MEGTRKRLRSLLEEGDGGPSKRHCTRASGKKDARKAMPKKGGTLVRSLEKGCVHG